jgi:two-component system response regulator BaeR
MTKAMKQTVLIVEDEIKLAELLRDYLSSDVYGGEHDCPILLNGSAVIPWLKENKPALILLDVMLPGVDGMTLCKEIRTFSDVPIIMLTARIDEIDRLLGLELGADDYICKPFSPREVVARVKAVLRRGQSSSRSDIESHSLQSPLTLDDASLKAVLMGHTLDLTLVEYRLLKLMYNQPGKIYSRGQLMKSIYMDHRVVDDRTIDSHIKKLRKKISDVLPNQEIIHSVYGVGYKFEL